jgi:hypothetical protein
MFQRPAWVDHRNAVVMALAMKPRASDPKVKTNENTLAKRASAGRELA